MGFPCVSPAIGLRTRQVPREHHEGPEERVQAVPAPFRE